MFKLVQNPEITFTLEFPKNAAGEIPSIELTCKVFPDEEIDGLKLNERLEKILVNVEGLVDEKNKALRYSPDLIPALCRQQGFVGLFSTAFNKAVVWGAEKNLTGLHS